MNATYPYNGYKIAVRDEPTVRGQPMNVAVWDPRFPHDGALYRTSSLDLAMKWIDAYRDGQAWAMNEAEENTVPGLIARGEW